MSQPKKKTSRSRRNQRRYSNPYKLDRVTTTNCSECGETIRPHSVCNHCFSYQGKSTLTGKES